MRCEYVFKDVNGEPRQCWKSTIEGKQFCSEHLTLENFKTEDIINKTAEEVNACEYLISLGNGEYQRCWKPKVPGYDLCREHLMKEILDTKDATGKLLHERGSIYGDIRDNTSCQYQLKKTYYAWLEVMYNFKDQEGYETIYTQRGFPSKLDMVAHDECMEYVFEKIARLVTGKMHEDNYKDGIGYFELARKIAMGEETKV